MSTCGSADVIHVHVRHQIPAVYDGPQKMPLVMHSMVPSIKHSNKAHEVHTIVHHGAQARQRRFPSAPARQRRFLSNSKVLVMVSWKNCKDLA